MEIISFFFIWLMLVSKDTFSIVPFFIVNSIVSVILFSYLFLKLYFFELKFFHIFLSSMSMINLNLAFSFKLGIIPFHMWVFEVSKSLSWKNLLNFFIMLKIIPFWSLYLSMNLNFLVMMILMNFLIFSFIPLKKVEVFFILTFSGILNYIWILVSMFLSFFLFLNYLFFYFLSSSLFIMMTKNSKKMFLEMKNFMSIIFLMGMPPMPLFFSKMIILKGFFFENYFISILIFLMIQNLISSFTYMFSLNLNLLQKFNFNFSNLESSLIMLSFFLMILL